jgi:cyclopropane-fatty-acyl-phospholipid synthase
MTDRNAARPRALALSRQETLLTRTVMGMAGGLLSPIVSGSARLRLPNGLERTFGEPGSGPHADLDVKRARLLWRALTRGSCGFAEGYMSGDLETASLADIFRFALDNRRHMRRGWHLFRVKAWDRLRHLARANTRSGSRRNIAQHYDLGNAFYAYWLDRGMTYSSGVFATGAETLEEAQAAKYARVLAHAGIRPGARVLEIGCGWGGFAEAAARAGAHVTALTLSAEQLAFARERIAAAGLAELCDLRLEDYRDATGAYDAIASIEMIEAVGEENWPTYFAALGDRLASGGAAVIQAITISEEAFPRYRARADFIQRYIFPGGMLPTRHLIAEHARAAGLSLEAEEQFGASYAATLWAWRTRFLEAWPCIERLGFDERFRRMWDYYLTYCAVGFERGLIDVGIVRLRKP